MDGKNSIDVGREIYRKNWKIRRYEVILRNGRNVPLSQKRVTEFKVRLNKELFRDNAMMLRARGVEMPKAFFIMWTAAQAAYPKAGALFFCNETRLVYNMIY